MAAKLGFADRKTTAPTDIPSLLKLLAEVMSASINNEIDLDNARTALNAATRDRASVCEFGGGECEA
jgi:hypothetical protein